jgi:chromosome partitioning protein
MYVVTPGQQKGGVGKTTITANLAAISGDFGLKVLAVDLDPQSHLTLSFGQQARPGYSTGELLNHSLDNRPTFDEVLIRDVVPNVDLLPGDERALERAENDIAADPIGGMTRLRQLLGTVGERYQLCFIDTPPKVEGLSVLAMVASDGIVIVSEPQTLAYASTKVYAAKVEQVAASPLNPHLRILGVLLNKVSEGEESTFITRLLRDSGLHVFDTEIPASKLASKAAAAGVPAALANRNHGIGKIYRAVADEISDRLTQILDEQPQAVSR